MASHRSQSEEYPDEGGGGVLAESDHEKDGVTSDSSSSVDQQQEQPGRTQNAFFSFLKLLIQGVVMRNLNAMVFYAISKASFGPEPCQLGVMSKQKIASSINRRINRGKMVD